MPLVDKSITIHLPEAVAGILHAEGITEEKSVSSLIWDRIVERLDLPEPYWL